MKQTSVEHIGRSQLIPGVRRTFEWMRTTGCCTIWLMLTASSAAASQPLPISAELRPATVLAKTPLELVLRSESTERLTLQVVSIVRVRRVGVQGYQPDVYWAPLDLAGGRSYREDASPSLKLAPGESLSVPFGLMELRWALELPWLFDHQWPHQGFASMVPPGEYEVWYELGDLAHSNDPRVTSRPVRLRVQ